MDTDPRVEKIKQRLTLFDPAGEQSLAIRYLLDRLAAADAVDDRCPHASATGVDQTPLADPWKRWRCDGCGWEYVGLPSAENDSIIVEVDAAHAALVRLRADAVDDRWEQVGWLRKNANNGRDDLVPMPSVSPVDSSTRNFNVEPVFVRRSVTPSETPTTNANDWDEHYGRC